VGCARMMPDEPLPSLVVQTKEWDTIKLLILVIPIGQASSSWPFKVPMLV
jgi:hypothetical protein